MILLASLARQLNSWYSYTKLGGYSVEPLGLLIPPGFFLFIAMYVLYLDESGNHSAASYFVLAGLAIFEREMYWYAQDMDALQQRYLPEVTEPVEFHAS